MGEGNGGERLPFQLICMQLCVGYLLCDKSRRVHTRSGTLRYENRLFCLIGSSLLLGATVPGTP